MVDRLKLSKQAAAHHGRPFPSALTTTLRLPLPGIRDYFWHPRRCKYSTMYTIDHSENLYFRQQLCRSLLIRAQCLSVPNSWVLIRARWPKIYPATVNLHDGSDHAADAMARRKDGRIPVTGVILFCSTNRLCRPCSRQTAHFIADISR